ncbi:MAG: flagellar export chaperone FliS [Candidatus Binatia bacterium]
MNTQQYANRYAQAQITSVDRKQLLLLVMDGGITFLRRARTALAEGKLVEYGESLRRGQAIVSELLSTLDYEAGGEIAKSLGRLYEFMLFHLTEGNARRSVRHLDDVLRVFQTIASAYREIIDTGAA